eukprot:6188071-Pleurochrysis_carterae.AAC.2
MYTLECPTHETGTRKETPQLDQSKSSQPQGTWPGLPDANHAPCRNASRNCMPKDISKTERGLRVAELRRCLPRKHSSELVECRLRPQYAACLYCSIVIPAVLRHLHL